MMKVTKVMFSDEKRKGRFLASCSVILDDCLRLNNIRLINGDGGRYLILPSKQDVYKSILEENKGCEIKLPTIPINNGLNEKGMYEEFFHPVKSDFYSSLLYAIEEAYESCCNEGKYVKVFK